MSLTSRFGRIAPKMVLGLLIGFAPVHVGSVNLTGPGIAFAAGDLLSQFAKPSSKAGKKAKTPKRARSATVATPKPDSEKSLLERAKLTTEQGDVPDFIRQSRPPEGSLGYVPLTGPVAEPSSPVMTRDQIKAREAELDSIRGRHDRMAGRKPAPAATKSVAAEPVVPKTKKKVRCLLTCEIK